ncbi:MAG: alcohol dehydrogenase catalytic domain-containing protein [Anaerovoracaceae bacterium]
MKAVVKYDNRDGATKIIDVEVPEITEHEVLIRVKYAGICGGDPHIHHNSMSYPPTIEVPIILGHECSGIVKEVGSKVKNVAVGDKVTCETHYGFCGQCFYCKQGSYNHCIDRKGLGASVNGVFAEYVKVSESVIHKLPKNLDLRKAALTEPLCIVYNAIINHTAFKGGDNVAIIGPGTIGLLSAMLVKALGAANVVIIGTDKDQRRYEIATKIGIDTADCTKLPKEEIVNKYTNGLGFDVVVDAAGNNPAFKMAVDLVRREGEISKIGFGPAPLDFSLDFLLLKGISAHFAFSHSWGAWEKCVQLLAGNVVDVEEIITHELPLEEFEKGFELIDSLEGIKVLLVP